MNFRLYVYWDLSLMNIHACNDIWSYHWENRSKSAFRQVIWWTWYWGVKPRLCYNYVNIMHNQVTINFRTLPEDTVL